MNLICGCMHVTVYTFNQPSVKINVARELKLNLHKRSWLMSYYHQIIFTVVEEIIIILRAMHLYYIHKAV